MRIGGLLILLALLAAPSSAAAARKSCARTGDTVMKNGTVRIFSTDAVRVYSCHLKSRRRTFLTRHTADYDSLEDYESFIRPRLAGRFVAFGDEFGCSRYGDCYGGVRVVDARSGENFADGGVFVPDGARNSRIPSLHALHLRPDGAAVFIAGPTFDQPYEIVRIGVGDPLRLDQGNIDPRSLATNARRIYWTRDGQPFTATWR